MTYNVTWIRGPSGVCYRLAHVTAVRAKGARVEVWSVDGGGEFAETFSNAIEACRWADLLITKSGGSVV